MPFPIEAFLELSFLEEYICRNPATGRNQGPKLKGLVKAHKTSIVDKERVFVLEKKHSRKDLCYVLLAIKLRTQT